jgi:Leucine-rich repeat (LRR) protein
MKRLENQKNLENLKNLKNLDMEENPIFRNINTIDKKKGKVAAALADTLG